MGTRVIQAVFESLVKGGGFDRHMSRVKILAGGDGALKAVMKIEKDDTNRGEFLHGAMSTLLVDALSTAALLSHPKATSPGLSININMSYMKAASIGQEILINASTDKIGKRLAFLSVDITEKESGDLIAQGKHTKFVG